MEIEEAKNICQKFANDHKLIFEPEGTCGFGRECVGFISKRGNWLDYNPHNSSSYAPIEGIQSDKLYPPEGVDAYHKHNCMAVLGRGDEAIIQLARWVQKLNDAGKVRVVEFETGAQGMQALMSGLLGYAVMAD